MRPTSPSRLAFVPLQHHQFRLAHQSGLHQAVLGHDFLVEQHDLALDGIELHPRSLDPLFQRLDALVDALDVAVEVVAARRERHLLAVHDFLHLGRTGQGELASQLTMSGGSVISGSSLISACSLASMAVSLMRRRNSRCSSARATVSSSSSSSLAGFHGVAFAHIDLADNAALEMLDDLVLPGNDEHARRDHCAGDRRHVAPDAEAHQHHGHDQHAGNRSAVWSIAAANRTRCPLLAAERSAIFLLAIA